MRNLTRIYATKYPLKNSIVCINHKNILKDTQIILVHLSCVLKKKPKTRKRGKRAKMYLGKETKLPVNVGSIYPRKAYNK